MIIYRSIDRSNLNELYQIAEVDSKIPVEFDRDYKWNEASIQAQLKKYEAQIQQDDFFEVAIDEEKNQIVGFHIVKKIQYPPDLMAAAIFSLWVNPMYRKQGIAKTLKMKAQSWAEINKLSYFLTNVHTNNLEMLNLNKKLGFEIIQHAMRKKV